MNDVYDMDYEIISDSSGPNAYAIVVDGVVIGFITENYDFRGNGTYSARVGREYFHSVRLGQTNDRDKAIGAVLKHAKKA